MERRPSRSRPRLARAGARDGREGAMKDRSPSSSPGLLLTDGSTASSARTSQMKTGTYTRAFRDTVMSFRRLTAGRLPRDTPPPGRRQRGGDYRAAARAHRGDRVECGHDGGCECTRAGVEARPAADRQGSSLRAVSLAVAANDRSIASVALRASGGAALKRRCSASASPSRVIGVRPLPPATGTNSSRSSRTRTSGSESTV